MAKKAYSASLAGIYPAVLLVEGKESFRDDLGAQAYNGKKDVFHVDSFLPVRDASPQGVRGVKRP
jgi:hypothetical protein